MLGRNMEDLKSGISTFDKPKFEGQSTHLGAIDVKLNHQGTRLAVTSIDFGITVYGIDPEGKEVKLLRKMSAGDHGK